MASSVFRVLAGLSIDDAANVLKGTADPSSVGLAAPQSSIYLRNNAGSNVELWFKQGATNTAWVKIADSSGAVNDEDPFQNTFMGKTGTGSETPTYSTNNVVTTGNSLETAIGSLDTEIGAAVTANTRTNSPISDQAINANIEALDDAIGSDADISAVARTTGPISTSQNLYQNIDDLDAAIGADVTANARTNNPVIDGNSVNANIEALDDAIGVDVTSTNYASTANTVNANISALDTQVKNNADSISTLSSNMAWRDTAVCITEDTDLGSASDGVTLSTLLPFSDDEGTQLAIGDFSAGDYILYQHSTTPMIWQVYDDGGTLKLHDSSDASVDALVDGDAFIIQNDLIDTPDAEETYSMYIYNGTTLIKIADVDWTKATNIALTSSYTASGGDVSSGDSVEAAIAKLDDNQDDILLTLGVVQGDTSLGDLTGAAEEILGNTESVKDALVDLSNEIGIAVTGTTYASDQAVNLNIGALDAELVNINTELDDINTVTHTSTIAASGNADVDTVSTTNLVSIEWVVNIINNTTGSNRNGFKVLVLTDGTSVDWTEYALLNLGAGVDYTVDVQIGGGNIDLNVTNNEASDAISVHATRSIVKTV